MSKADIERFVNDVKSNSALRDELKTAGIDEGGIVDFAKSKGYEITAEEVKSHLEAKKAALSDEELDKVAGGSTVSTEAVEVAEAATTAVTVSEVAQDAAAATTVVAVAELVAT